MISHPKLRLPEIGPRLPGALARRDSAASGDFCPELSFSGHTVRRNKEKSTVALRERMFYFIQQLSAEGDLQSLGSHRRSGSVNSCVAIGERTITGRRAMMATRTERRRQTCPPPSNLSWPLACLLSPLPALSRKRFSWSMSRSWKKKLCRSTDSSVSPGAPWRARNKLARPTGGRPC